MSDELLPCPFRTENEDHSLTVGQRPRVFGPHRPYSVLCGCGASGPMADTEQEAVQAWNRRVKPADARTFLVKWFSDTFEGICRDQHEATAEACQRRIREESGETPALLAASICGEVRDSDPPPIRRDDA